MDIYILRDGQEMGPFSEEATQTLLKQGSVLIHDLAWQPGMSQWIPLHSVLYPAPPVVASTSPEVESEPDPPTDDPVASSTDESESITAKQKAFLSYMGIPVVPGLTKKQAALLVNDALETPSDPARLLRWNEERLRLHPELFQAEIQAKRDNRANYFHEIIEAEGAGMFDRVTKAHCQVLVGFLDVHYPNWDANEHHAKWDYFFPAVAEEFPQLVKKEWKGRLKFREGPKVAPEVARRSIPAGSARRDFPFGAVLRGVTVGLSILILLYAGYWVITRKPSPSGKNSMRSATAAQKKGPMAAGTATQPEGTGTSVNLEKLFAEATPIPGNASGPSSGAATSSVDSPAGAPMTTATSNPSLPAESAAQASSAAVPLFDPTVPGPVTPGATLPADAGSAQPRTSFVITKATEVQLRFGRAKLLPGTVVKFVSHDGSLLRVRYGNEVVAVPVSCTDFNEVSAAAPVPAATPPAPATQTNTAPPPPPTSLFDSGNS